MIPPFWRSTWQRARNRSSSCGAGTKLVSGTCAVTEISESGAGVVAFGSVVVRGLLAPALVAALGHLNWTMPGPLRRLLRVAE